MIRVHVLSSAPYAIVGKLVHKLKGPCKVLSQKAEHIFEVKDADNGSKQTVHVKDMKSFHPQEEVRRFWLTRRSW